MTIKELKRNDRGAPYPLPTAGFKKEVMIKPKPVFTKNEAEAMLHKGAAKDLRVIATHVEEHNYTAEQIIEWLRELADQSEAQAVVVELRDKL